MTDVRVRLPLDVLRYTARNRMSPGITAPARGNGADAPAGPPKAEPPRGAPDPAPRGGAPLDLERLNSATRRGRRDRHTDGTDGTLATGG